MIIHLETMTMRYWIRTVLFLFVLFGYTKSKACGYSISEFNGFQIFLNPMEEEFHLSSYLYHPYRYIYKESTTITAREDNLAEWMNQFSKDWDLNEFSFILYQDHLSDLKLLQEGKLKKKPFSSIKLRSNRSIFSLIYSDLDLINYLILIDDYSFYSSKFKDEWNYAYHIEGYDNGNLAKNINEAKKAYQKISKRKDKFGKFLLERLAYHIVRASYFNGDTDNAIQDFAIYAKPIQGRITSSLAQEWLVGIEAGLELRKGNLDKSFLLYSKRFNQGKDHYTPYIDINNLSKRVDINRVLSFAINTQDSLDVYSGIFATEHNSITKRNILLISQIPDPNIQFFTWLRELQKLEQNHFLNEINVTNYFTKESSAEVDEENNAALKRFRVLTKNLFMNSKDKKFKEQYLNALAYLGIMDGTNNSWEMFNLYSFSNQKASQQAIVTRLLHFIKNKKHISNTDLIQFLEVWNNPAVNVHENSIKLSYFMSDILAPYIYENEGREIEAMLLWAAASPKYPRNLKEFSLSESTIVQDLLNYTYNTNQYLELKDQLASKSNVLHLWFINKGFDLSFYNVKRPYNLFFKYVRDKNWTMAKQLVGESDMYSRSRNYYNPFIMHYDSYLSPSKIDSSRSFLSAEEFFDLGDKLKLKVKHNGSGQDHLNYGMYLWSTTYHGLNSITDGSGLNYHYSMTANDKIAYYDVDTFKTSHWLDLNNRDILFKASKEALDHYNAYSAEYHFKKAFNLLENRETKAMTCFLLAKCYQTRAPQNKSVSEEDGDFSWSVLDPIEYKGGLYESFELHSLTNPYFKTLKYDFGDTETYRIAFDECSYLEYFLD
jgi:hypothetical protein